MSEARWTVRRHRGSGGIDPAGWVVCDRGRRISRSWANYWEAERHRDRIAELYAKYGW